MFLLLLLIALNNPKMLQQVQNPFLDKNVNNDRLFISFVVIGLITFGLISSFTLNVKRNEDI
jgi:hypothetical protein